MCGIEKDCIVLHYYILLIIVVYRKRVSSTFFHIFTHFSTFFHPYHYISQTVAANYTIVKRKWGIPKTLLMNTLIRMPVLHSRLE